MGQIYIPVDANAVNEIMALNGSGGEGVEEGGYWLHWDSTGFSGRGWFWGDPNNQVPTWWSGFAPDGYASDDSGLKKYIEDTGISDLPIGAWPSKGDFVENNIGVLGIFGKGGCVEFV